MAEPTAKPNLYQRILYVIEGAGALNKTGQTDRQWADFKYHKIDDVVDALRPICRAVGLVMLPCVSEAKTEPYEYQQTGRDGKSYIKHDYITNIRLELTLVNPDDPMDRVTISSVGDGIDSGDKSAGKAMSYALKNALLALFQLRGQPDNEEDEHDHSRPATQTTSGNARPADELLPIANWRDVVNHVRKPLNKETGKREVTPAQLGKLPKNELDYWIDQYKVGDPNNPMDVRLRKALDIARAELRDSTAAPGTADNPM